MVDTPPKLFPSSQESFGDYESYTKDLGSRILSKMGHDGKGFGKNGQGMVNYIEVVQRPRDGCLGLMSSIQEV